MWNMDKHGIALDFGVNSRIMDDVGDFISSGTKMNFSSPENRESVTAIWCISAVGLELDQS